eukprot:3693666-Pyramimonas_sp.AAC.1
MEEAAGDSGSSRGYGKYRHSTEKLMLAIRTSSLLRGGASGLHVAVQRAIALAAPECVASVICRGIEANGDRRHFQKSTLPSVSTIMRGE